MSTYRFISAERASFPVSLLCEVLGVSRSGFHAWRMRAPNNRRLSDAWLSERIKEIHGRARGVRPHTRYDFSSSARTHRTAARQTSPAHATVPRA